MKNKKFFILIGRSGSGKGTQAELLIKHLEEKEYQSVKHFTTGEGFRDFIKTENNYSAEVSRQIVNSGGLMPNFLAVWNWTNLFIKNIQEDDTIILDGAPRKIVELEALARAIKFYKFQKPIVIYFDVSESWAMNRLKERGREDDADMENIKKKMEWFFEDVLPCVEFYKDNEWTSNFIHVNGEQAVEEVHDEVVKKIKDMI